ncbi:MAG: metal-dependent transcriptional regulator, partial [Anaerolineae bacterium]|nr:metal-dependent transcriptional regulator [Anaerolineae bacterium]
MQDYLKTIYELRQHSGRATTNALAEKLNVAAASVTGMIKKLAEMKLVEYERYQGVGLTQAGEKMALAIVRHHRLIELYLTEAMGYTWDRVHEEADRPGARP